MGHWVKPNHNMVAEYQGAGMPFVTASNGSAEVPNSGSPVSVSFPGVTRWLEIRNTGDQNLLVGFSANGVTGKGAVTGSNPVDGRALSGTPGSEPAAQGNHKNYFVLPGGESTGRWELKASSVFFYCDNGDGTDFAIAAGITNIPVSSFVHLSGSEGYRGVG